MQTMLRLAMSMPLALLAACGGDDDRPAIPAPVTAVAYASRCGLPDAAAEPYRTVAPTGAHCVGATEFLVTDDARDETLTQEPGDRRALRLRVIYPADPPSGAVPGAVRMPYEMAEVPGSMTVWPAALQPQSHAWRDARPAIGRPAPVLLFSPGLHGPAQAYAGLAEELASHGYVVAAIDHPYISAATPLPDGRIAHPILEEEDGTVPEDVAEARHQAWASGRLAVAVADQGTVLDWLARQHATPGSLLGGRLDLDRIGAYGHSFGGATALQVQRTDARVTAAVDLDGTVYGDISQPWTKPFMILQSVHAIDGQPVEEDTMKSLWQNRQGYGQLEVMPGSCHGDFADVHRLLDLYNTRNPASAVEVNPQLYCSKDPEALERGVRSRLLDFFGRHLR